MSLSENPSYVIIQFMDKLNDLCKQLGAHSVRLVYTFPTNTWGELHSWQVIAKYQDDSEQFFKQSKTAQGAIDTAIEQANSKPPHKILIGKSWDEGVQIK
jgi:hypothetical protein